MRRSPAVGAIIVVVACCVVMSHAATTPSHRIQIRTLNGEAEFYDTRTGKRFTPRGNNYVRLAKLKKLSEPTSMVYHSTFNKGAYNKKRASAALKAMAAQGYNVVRVFMNHATEGSLSGPSSGLSKAYLDNMANFLTVAKTNNIYVIPTIDWIPVPRPKGPVDPLWCPDFQCTNVHILTTEGVRANQTFFVTLVKELAKRKAPTDYILAYELRNELTFESELPPLTLTSGRLTAANGKTYDLSDDGQKARMLEEGLVHWVNEVRSAIRAADPTALVTVGFIPPQKPHPMRAGDTKLSVTAPVIQSSTVDFVDIHVYPAADKWTMKEFAENFGIVGVKAMPIVMGEFGALLETYTSVHSAARGLADWQAASLKYGVDGWISWAWDIDVGRDSWAATDSAGVIARALSPKRRSDPGSAVKVTSDVPVVFPKSARASGSTRDEGPELAIDGTMRQWSSGGFPPQWIELELPSRTLLTEVRLTVGQTPNGPTVHQVWLKAPGNDFAMVHEFKGATKDLQVLVFRPKPAVLGESMKIVTTVSPSWVGWREIEIIGKPAY